MKQQKVIIKKLTYIIFYYNEYPSVPHPLLSKLHNFYFILLALIWGNKVSYSFDKVKPARMQTNTHFKSEFIQFSMVLHNSFYSETFGFITNLISLKLI